MVQYTCLASGMIVFSICSGEGMGAAAFFFPAIFRWDKRARLDWDWDLLVPLYGTVAFSPFVLYPKSMAVSLTSVIEEGPSVDGTAAVITFYYRSLSVAKGLAALLHCCM